MKCLTPEKVGLRRDSGQIEDSKLSFKDDSIYKTPKYDLFTVHVDKNLKYNILPL